jgi:hypothetical protein
MRFSGIRRRQITLASRNEQQYHYPLHTALVVDGANWQALMVKKYDVSTEAYYVDIYITRVLKQQVMLYLNFSLLGHIQLEELLPMYLQFVFFLFFCGSFTHERVDARHTFIVLAVCLYCSLLYCIYTYIYLFLNCFFFNFILLAYNPCV